MGNAQHQLFKFDHTLLIGDGKSPEVKQKVQEVIPKIDLLFLDSLHTKDQLFSEYLNFYPLLHEESILLIHDSYDPGLQEAIHQIKKHDDAWDMVYVGGAATYCRRSMFPTIVNGVERFFGR